MTCVKISLEKSESAGTYKESKVLKAEVGCLREMIDESPRRSDQNIKLARTAEEWCLQIRDKLSLFMREAVLPCHASDLYQ